MRRDDLRPDDELRAMLRRFDSPERVSADQRDALLSRIGADADLLLAARRPGPPAWWEFTAGWARTLIPLGVATAMVAAGVLLWTAHGAPPRELPRVASQDSLVSAVPRPRDRTSQRLLDVLVSPAVMPAADGAAASRVRE